jgi:hypothetical protein
MINELTQQPAMRFATLSRHCMALQKVKDDNPPDWKEHLQPNVNKHNGLDKHH